MYARILRLRDDPDPSAQGRAAQEHLDPSADAPATEPWAG
jgi:hypothetical protein